MKYNNNKQEFKEGGDMSYSSRELLARLIKCEAGGEGENGMKAVAAVIMNRVNVSGGEYLRVDQGDVTKVIMQPEQFTCASAIVYGQSNTQNIWSSEPDQQHYAIADWALSGNKLPSVGEALWYFNPFSSICPNYFPPNKNGSYVNTIGQHCFYLPTPKYYKT
jgi:N-acetylmuramoyl-L-alanine amidase